MIKKISCIILAVIMVLTVFFVKQNFSYATQIDRYYDSVSSSVDNVMVYDVREDKVLFSKNADERISMGSVVKLVTALTASEVLSPEDSFIVGEEVDFYLTADASRSMIKNGQHVSFTNLLYALLIPSGCDAANTIAVNCARKAAGNEEMPVEDALTYFVSMMNDYAKKLGCNDSFFVNPDGQDAEGQYMTLNNVVTFAKKVLENELLMQVVGTSEAKITLLSGEVYEWTNTNRLLMESSDFYYEHAKGLKTGYTTDAGYTLASYAERDGEKVICLVAKCDKVSARFTVSEKLCQLAFADCLND